MADLQKIPPLTIAANSGVVFQEKKVENSKGVTYRVGVLSEKHEKPGSPILRPKLSHARSPKVSYTKVDSADIDSATNYQTTYRIAKLTDLQ